MRISDYPRVSLRSALGAGAGADPFQAVYGKAAACFYLARGALWQAIRLLRLQGPDTVLVPSYHCSAEIDAILQADVGIEFYAIKDDMTADLEDLARRVTPKTKAIFVIHYFGFPQPIEAIQALARARGLFLIEDCAHALFSAHQGRLLGTFGELAIFSQRKSLPLPDGGALLMNHPATTSMIDAVEPSRAVVWKRTLGLLCRSGNGASPSAPPSSVTRWLRKLLHGMLPANHTTTYGTGLGFHPSMGRVRMSSISRRIMEGISAHDVVQKRRRHFLHLLERLRGSTRWSVCFASLPEGICPLFFPIRVAGGARDGLRRRLQQAGIEPFVFGEWLHPALPTHLFPEAAALSRDILCLPIHQDVTDQQLEFLVTALRDAERHGEVAA